MLCYVTGPLIQLQQKGMSMHAQSDVQSIIRAVRWVAAAAGGVLLPLSSSLVVLWLVAVVGLGWEADGTDEFTLVGAWLKKSSSGGRRLVPGDQNIHFTIMLWEIFLRQCFTSETQKCEKVFSLWPLHCRGRMTPRRHCVFQTSSGVV